MHYKPAADADEVEKELRAWNASEADIAAARAQCVPDTFEVLAQNEVIVTAFEAVATQWRVGVNGKAIGLDYCSVDIALNRLHIHLNAEQFQGLQLMERAVINELNRHD